MPNKWFSKKKKSKKKAKRYTAAQRRAYHIGFGVGLAGEYDTVLTRHYKDTLSPAEMNSYIDGYARGDQNGSLLAGGDPFARRKKKNGKS